MHHVRTTTTFFTDHRLLLLCALGIGKGKETRDIITGDQKTVFSPGDGHAIFYCLNAQVLSRSTNIPVRT